MGLVKLMNEKTARVLAESLRSAADDLIASYRLRVEAELSGDRIRLHLVIEPRSREEKEEFTRRQQASNSR